MKRVLLGLIRVYQRYISPGFPRRCRFSPTCSQYAFEAIEKYGAIKGGWLAIKRLLRCNPFYKATTLIRCHRRRYLLPRHPHNLEDST